MAGEIVKSLHQPQARPRSGRTPGPRAIGPRPHTPRTRGRLEYTPAEYEKHSKTHAQKILSTVSAAAASAGVSCETLHVEHEHPYQGIIDTAASKGCDLVLMASHGRRGVAAVVLGSETVKVLTHSKIPVLVYR